MLCRLDLLGILWTHGLKKHAPEQDLVQAARVLWWLLNEEDVPPTGDRELLNGSSRDRLFQDILLAALAYQDISDVRVVYGDWEVQIDGFYSALSPSMVPPLSSVLCSVGYRL